MVLELTLFWSNHRFNNVKNFNVNNENNLVASCTLDGIHNDLNKYYFPKAYSKKNISINICNYRKYLTIIFNDFYCEKKYLYFKSFILSKCK